MLCLSWGTGPGFRLPFKTTPKRGSDSLSPMPRGIAESRKRQDLLFAGGAVDTPQGASLELPKGQKAKGLEGLQLGTGEPLKTPRKTTGVPLGFQKTTGSIWLQIGKKCRL